MIYNVLNNILTTFTLQKYKIFLYVQHDCTDGVYFCTRKQNNNCMNRKQRFISKITKHIKKEGCECTVRDNSIVIQVDDKCFVVGISDVFGLVKRRVNISLNFAFENMNSVQPAGLLWLASEINNLGLRTTTQVWKDHFSCRVDTVVYSPKDFMKEFVCACQDIGNTFQNIVSKYDSVKKQFNNDVKERRPIGFMADRYMQNEENSEPCKLVAQTNANFATKN